jgi:hypothetical protein
MDIKNKFLKLTKRTYPYGFEDQLVSHLPKGYFKDKWGNYYYKIGESKTAFTCHLDTASKTQVDIVHKFEKNIISTDGKSILGADDKAGMIVLLYMIEKRIPGLYCFFIGEESGCIGSGKACEDSWTRSYDRMISFDRRGTDSIITYQSSKRCCSEEFAKELAVRLNANGLSMKPDDTGVYTDSAEFTGVIPECTNISVGYYKEHTVMEHQDIQHLIKLCIAVTRLNWENLPTVRDHKIIEYKPYSYGKYGNSKGFSSYDYDSSKYSKSSGFSTHDQWDGWDKSPAKRSQRRDNRRDYYSDYSYYDTFGGSGYDSYESKDKNGRAYFENLDNDLTDSYFGEDKYKKDDTFMYESMKQDIYNDVFTKEEMKKIDKQYLNDDIGFEYDSKDYYHYE